MRGGTRQYINHHSAFNSLTCKGKENHFLSRQYTFESGVNLEAILDWHRG
jgi:hypothetical protein